MEQVLELELDKLVPAKQNPRGADVGDVAELAASIKAMGIVEPLIVTRNGSDKFVVVAGHRRLAAARVAGLKTVPTIARAFENERTMLTTMLVENLQRVDLSPLQEAHGFQQLADLKYSQREIAAKVGRSQSHIAKRLALLKLSPSASAKFESGGITAEDAVVLAAQPPSTQERVLKETNYGSMAARIRQLEYVDEARKRDAAAAKSRPAAEARWKAEADKQRAAERTKERLRKEAQIARARILPRIVSRGERELQYAAGAIAEQLQVDVARVACEILGVKASKPKRQYSSIDYRGALAKQAQASKAKAIAVLLALALAAGETSVRSPYAGPGDRSAQHIRLLVKAGYKPGARDRALLKGRRR